MIPKVNLKLFVGILLMLILQEFLSPIIQINGIVPNFIVAFCVAVSCAQPKVPFLWFTCLAGILYDLVCGTAIGPLAISLVVTVFFVTLILGKVEEPKTWMIILTILLAIFFAETIYGVFQIVFISDYSIIDVFITKIIPCTIYDTIAALLILPIASKLFAIIPIEEPIDQNTPRSDIDV